MFPISHALDFPKILVDPALCVERSKELGHSHMKDLANFVAELRKEVGPGARIPDFDPWDGGVNAKILFLMEAPGAKAVHSGFVSRNNPDETAKNFFVLSDQSVIPRRDSIIWNVVPWYIGSGKRIRKANGKDVASGIPSLIRLLAMLPNLCVIVLVGKNAQKIAKFLRREFAQIRVFESYHPSPMFVNIAPGNRERILKVFREASAFLSKSEGS